MKTKKKVQALPITFHDGAIDIRVEKTKYVSIKGQLGAVVGNYFYQLRPCVGGTHATKGFTLGHVEKGRPRPRIVRMRDNVDPKTMWYVLIFEGGEPA